MAFAFNNTASNGQAAAFGSKTERLSQTAYNTNRFSSTLSSPRSQQLAATARAQLQQHAQRTARLTHSATPSYSQTSSKGGIPQLGGPPNPKALARFHLPLPQNGHSQQQHKLKKLDALQSAGIDSRNAAVVSMTELQLLHSDYGSTQNGNLSFNELQALKKQQSQERYSTWHNTIEQKRLQKQHEREQRLVAYELEQQRIDAEEALHKEQERQKVLQTTAEQLYKDNDRVKSMMKGYTVSGLKDFHSQQIAEKHATTTKMHADDEQWLRLAKQLAADAEKEEQDRLQKREIEKHELLAIQAEQLQEIKQRKQYEKQLNQREGERLRDLALQLEQQQIQDEGNRKHKQALTNRQYIAENAEQQQWKAKRQAESAAEDQKIAEFAERKEKTYAARRAQEEALFNAKQAQIAAIIDAQVDHLSAIKAQEDSRLVKQIEEFEIKQAYQEKSRAERAAAIQRDIEYSREQQIIKARQAEAERQAIEAEVMRRWQEENQQALQQQKAEEQARQQRAIKNQQELLQQIRERDESTMKSMVKDRQLYEYTQQRQQEEDERFQHFVEQKTQELEAAGKSLLPVKLALKKSRPDRPFGVTY